MNFDLKEEQKEFQRNLRKVCEELLRPKAREVDRDGMVPEENLLELAKAGYMGLTIPPELGGCGMDMVSVLGGNGRGRPLLPFDSACGIDLLDEVRSSHYAVWKRWDKEETDPTSCRRKIEGSLGPYGKGRGFG
jgi:Acyl-CoA dehydrogenases